MKLHLPPPILMLFGLCLPLAAQVPQRLNYQGRVAVGTQNFAGTGQFKFMPYAIAVEQAATTADGAVTTPKLGGTVPAAKLAPDAARENLAASGFGGVPKGAALLSFEFSDSAIASAGYTYAGSTSQKRRVEWVRLPNLPTARYAHTANWLYGSRKFLVWGGKVDGGGGVHASTGSGDIFDVETLTWSPAPTLNAPASRSGHTSVEYDGKYVLIWGGASQPVGQPAVLLNTGAKFDGSTGVWTAITTTGAPTARTKHTAYWTGTEMIIFGGETGANTYTGTGARYNPATDTWTALPTGAGSPGSRSSHTAERASTVSTMMIWGGQNSAGVLGTGSIYDAASNTWSAMPLLNAPEARTGHSADHGYIWGGRNAAGTQLNTGKRYDAGVWKDEQLASNPPTAREGAVMTLMHGAFFLMWGGKAGTGASLTYPDGAYFSGPDGWTATPEGPQGREEHTLTYGSGGESTLGLQNILCGGIRRDTTPPVILKDCYTLLNPQPVHIHTAK